MAAIMAQNNDWSERRCSGRSITTSRQLKKGLNGHGTIDIPALALLPSPGFHIRAFPIWMRWRFNLRRCCSLSPIGKGNNSSGPLELDTPYSEG